MAAAVIMRRIWTSALHLSWKIQTVGSSRCFMLFIQLQWYLTTVNVGIDLHGLTAMMN